LALILSWPVGECAAGEKGKLAMEKREYKGWRNNLWLSNGAVELIVTLDVGPRIISYRFAKGKNVFAEYPKELGGTGEKEWKIRGGHRLWVAPEDLTRTYAPDNSLVAYREEGGGKVRFIPEPETEYGIQKEVVVQLAPAGSHVKVVHVVKNVGEKPTTLAPWALSVLAPGGIEIIPLPARRPHPGPPQNARSPKDYAPNQTMVLWPFFEFRDPRWKFGSKYITLKQDRRGPTKLGLAHQMGWVGYLNQGTLFVKSFGYEEGKTYPDNGCNFETFTNEDMLEMETLGPLVNLAPGNAVEMTEEWDLIADVASFQGEAGIDLNVAPKLPKR
jgi:hypothetical protein